MSTFPLRRALATLAVTGAATAAVVLGAEAPASAVAVGNTSAAGVSPMAASATAACPGGTVLVGTGGQINNGNGGVVMTDIIPDLANGTVTVWGHEIGAYAPNWSVTAVAICEPVAGVVLVASTSAFNGVATKTETPVCPAGTSLTGLGYQLVNGNGQVLPRLAQPNGLASATLSATEIPGFGQPWQITGYALCAPPAGFAPQVFSAVNGPNSLTPKQATTGLCPAGTDLFGTGAAIEGPVAGGDVVLDQMVPDPGQSFTVSQGQEDGAFLGNWSAVSYSICW